MSPPLTEAQVREIIRSEFRTLISEDLPPVITSCTQTTVDNLLVRFGMQVNEPLELQRDFQHLRDFRVSYNSIKSKATLTMVGILISGLCAIVWLGFKEYIRSELNIQSPHEGK